MVLRFSAQNCTPPAAPSGPYHLVAGVRVDQVAVQIPGHRRELRTRRGQASRFLSSQLPISAAKPCRIDTRLPLVALARKAGKVDSVRSNDAFGAALAVEHLGGLGHRAIVHLDGGRAPGAWGIGPHQDRKASSSR